MWPFYDSILPVTSCPEVEKFLAQTCLKLGDSAAAQAHASEARRLQQQLSGDAVERSAAATDAAARQGIPSWDR